VRACGFNDVEVLIVRGDMATGARSSRVFAALAIVAATLVVSPAAQASTYRETFVTLVGERQDFITRGKTRYFHSGNSSIGVAGTTRWLSVNTGEGPDGEQFSLEFSAPSGEHLKVGHHYTGAQRSSDLGVPGIDIHGGHRGCNETSGRFVIKDMFLGDNYRVARLWLLFEQRCGRGAPMVGEVRFRMPGDGGDLMVAPHAIRWPTLPIKGIAAPVAVRAVNTTSSALTVSSAAIEGSPDMEIRYDECSGRTLVSNESCAVWVRFSPTSSGVHDGRLRITEPSGASHVTDFSANVVSETAPFTPGAGEPGATVEGAPTEFSFQSEPGDYIGQGESRSYDPTNATFFVAYAGADIIYADIFGNDGETWSVWFTPPLGDILAPGYVYNDARRAGFTGRAGLDISGDARGCNALTGSFTVHSLRVDDFDNPVSLRVTFEQHCEDRDAALRGVFSWQHPGPLPTPQQFTPPPGGAGLARLVTITIKNRRAQGVVKVEEGSACRTGVPVKLQRKIDGRFRTVATLKTDGSGRYVNWIGKRYGIYRAVIPRVELSDGTICLRDVSSSWRY
jgi:hypothetical protein